MRTGKSELWRTKRRRDQSCWLTWGKFKEILSIYPIVWPRVYLTSAYRKESEFPIEEPIAFIGHDGFCEGL